MVCFKCAAYDATLVGASKEDHSTQDVARSDFVAIISRQTTMEMSETSEVLSLLGLARAIQNQTKRTTIWRGTRGR
jgi:4-hydroxy-3-methylbut-2-enyl diphosphate reductase IspH